MSDEQATDLEYEGQDTATDDATLHEEDTAVEPDETQGGDNWEERYKELQSKYTPTAQELAELKRNHEQLAPHADLIRSLDNPATRRDALNELLRREGFELPPDEDTDEDDDGVEFRDPRVDELIQTQQQRDLEQAFGEFEQHVDTLIKDGELELSARERKALVAECVEAGFNKDATEKVVSEWKAEIEARHDALIKSYRDGKRKQPAPAVRRGSAGTEQVPMDTGKARFKASLDVANEAFVDS